MLPRRCVTDPPERQAFVAPVRIFASSEQVPQGRASLTPSLAWCTQDTMSRRLGLWLWRPCDVTKSHLGCLKLSLYEGRVATMVGVAGVRSLVAKKPQLRVSTRCCGGTKQGYS